MATFILTWNPEQWHWVDLADAAEQTTQGEVYSSRCSSDNTKRIEPGDRVFLLKQVQHPKRFIEAGWIPADSYASPHWNRERADRCDLALRVNVDFERIMNPNNNQPLSTDSFTGALAEIYWAMPASGTQISDDAATELEKAWAA